MKLFVWAAFLFTISASCFGQDREDDLFPTTMTRPGIASGIELGVPRFRVEAIDNPLPLIEGDRYDPAWHPSYIELLKSPDVVGALRLSEGQSLEVIELYKRLVERVEGEVELLNANPELTMANHMALGHALADHTREMCSEVDDRFFSLLSRSQQHVLRSETSRLRVQAIGLQEYLDGGFLATDLGVSESHAAEIEKVLRRELARMEREASRLIEEVNQKLIAELEPEQQRIVHELVGDTGMIE